MVKLPRTENLSYLWSAIAVAIAFGARWALEPWVYEEYTFWFFVPAVAIAAWQGGIIPALVAVALSVGCGLFLFHLHTGGLINNEESTSIFLFAVTCCFVISVVQALRRSLRKEIVSRPVVEAPVAAPTRRDFDTRYKSILDHTIDAAIITLDSNRIIREWNAGATQITGWTRGEMVGRSADELFTPDDIEKSEPSHEQLIAEATGKAPFSRWLRRKDGNTFLADGTLRVMPGDLGEPRGFIKVFVDGTVRHQNYEETVNAVLKRAKDAEVLTYSMAHDMRQYMRGINTNATMMIRDLDGTLSEDQKSGLNRLRENATRMYQMIEGILDHLRVGRLPTSLKPVNLSLLGEEAVERLRSMDGADKVHFIIQPGLWVKGDKDLLSMVLNNIFENAIKYAGGRVILGHDAAKNAYYVRDEGPGFDPNYADDIFGLFHRLHGQEKPGNGIGLANVKRIIERHEGKIWAESAPGQGATFYFTLKSDAEQVPAGSLR